MPKRSLVEGQSITVKHSDPGCFETFAWFRQNFITFFLSSYQPPSVREREAIPLHQTPRDEPIPLLAPSEARGLSWVGSTAFVSRLDTSDPCKSSQTLTSRSIYFLVGLYKRHVCYHVYSSTVINQYIKHSSRNCLRTSTTTTAIITATAVLLQSRAGCWV